MTIEVKRRFGGHEGGPTEWEIATDEPLLKEFIRNLPQFPRVLKIDVSQPDYYRAWIYFPVGLPRHLIGEALVYLESMEREPLVATLEKMSRLAAESTEQKPTLRHAVEEMRRLLEPYNMWCAGVRLGPVELRLYGSEDQGPDCDQHWYASGDDPHPKDPERIVSYTGALRTSPTAALDALLEAIDEDLSRTL
jgi:hypothetical protein